ncbi:MAG: mechanosensitive ion channel family protein, partial [Vicinamibacteria bacterium]
MIEWLIGPSGDWVGIAIAVGIAVVVAYAVAVLAGRLARRALAGFAPADSEAGAAGPVADAMRARDWERPVRVTRAVVFAALLLVLLLPLIDIASGRVAAQVSRDAFVAWVMSSGLRILLVALLAYLLVRAIATSTARLEAQVLSGGGPDRVEHVKRARTLGRLIKNALTAVVLGVATLTILRELNVDIMPLLTGAGIVGLAVGFGAQTLVKDLISGVFLILDDNVRVGDVARINGTGGLVEAINLRTIVLRDHEGTLHVFPNGGITTLSNMTKDFAYAVVDVGVGYTEDPDRVVEVLRAVGAEVAADPAIAPNVLAPVEVQGLETLSNGQMTVRLRLKARPQTQWDIGRELRRRIKKTFDAQGLHLSAPPGTITLIQG